MEQEQSKFNIGKVLKVILIVVGILIICAAVFCFFKIRVDAKAALRDAKNVRMALQSADIEMYGAGKTIYNPNNIDGLEDGVESKVNQIFEAPGTYQIDSYSSKKHEMTGMTYKEGNYTVTFYKQGEDVTWDVDMRLDIYHFVEVDDED